MARTPDGGGQGDKGTKAESRPPLIGSPRHRLTMSPYHRVPLSPSHLLTLSASPVSAEPLPQHPPGPGQPCLGRALGNAEHCCHLCVRHLLPLPQEDHLAVFRRKAVEHRRHVEPLLRS